MLATLATLAAAIWLLTGVLKRIPALKPVDPAVVALGVAVCAGVAAYTTGYVDGNPVEVAAQLAIALFGAKMTHDGVSKPLTDLVQQE